MRRPIIYVYLLLVSLFKIKSLSTLDIMTAGAFH
jgi:hypothetical protein